MMNLQGLKSHGRLGVVLPVLLAMLCGTPAAAFQFDFGEVEGSLDSTISYGMSWRMSDQDKDIVGLANGGRAYSVNGDDGNLNYDRDDAFSSLAKITSDLDLRHDNFGLFLRGSAFYDFENYDEDRERTQLSDDAKDLVGKDAELLDAYIWGNFELGDMPAQLRVGDQVLSWGESTFIQNGINIINPFDVSKLRVPGAELKEGLVPVGMVSASISPTENLTFEGFYQYDWEKVEIDPTGFYWSSNDIPGESGDRVLLGFGDWSDLGTSWQGGVIPFEITDDRFMMVPRAGDEKPSDDGQYGLAMRVYAPGLNDTEFGFYFINYHSRLPTLSGVTGTQTGFAKATGALTGIGTFAAVYDPNNPASIPPAVTAGITNGTLAGIGEGLDPAEAQAVATGAVNAATTGNASLANAYIVNEYAQTAKYKVEYPEDIKVYGVSFNTALDSIGASLQGEYSYHKDAPLQVDDVELLLAALSPLGDINPLFPFSDNQLTNGGNLGLDTYVRGYEEKDVSQLQMTMTKLFGPTFGADQFVMVGEAGVTHVHGMPSKSDMRFESAGTYVTGNPDQAAAGGAHAGKSAESSDVFADATSWGYRAVAKMDFNNAVGAVTLSPRIAWSHDVDGNTPGPGGSFIEDRKAVTYGIGASYQSTWSADLSYTNYFGASRYNLLNDRDFVALNIKYSF
ncbi:DUF1302 domain-containing protein [Deltaproteobacteria bacterium IMCC39524]|nr:DUF1302 domain-containing protein [Deltaproteobacteria bacterium IMCC39524]